MATWQPKRDEPIGKNEPLGRRLFDEPMLAGAQEQPRYEGLLVRHFQERRDLEFSLDRLGLSGVDRRVVKYLLPRALAASHKLKPVKPFHGWAVIRAGVLSKPSAEGTFTVAASPIAGTDLDENVYHAHATLPEGETSLSVALRLRHLFTSQGFVEPIPLEEQREVGRLKSILSRWLRRILQLLEG